MAPTIEQIVNADTCDPQKLERVAMRVKKPPITIVEPKTEWQPRSEEVKERIQKALGPLVLAVEHIGSTSVSGLPAKDIIDIDLVLTDVNDEASYVKPLEMIGFRFILRDPDWYQHHFFSEDALEAAFLNLHVWGADSPEPSRHRILRDWLVKSPEDRELYGRVKREAAEQVTLAGDSMLDYTERRAGTINQILQRAFLDLGFIP